MTTIWKYPLDVACSQVLVMPTDATILCVQTQRQRIYLWALVDPARKGFDRRHFSVYGTGHDLPRHPGTYLGTVQIEPFVWHVFEDAQEEGE